MRENKVQLYEMLDKISDGVFALDDQWRFTFVNVKACQLLLRTQDDLIGTVIWDEFPAAVKLSFFEHYHKAMKEQVFVAFEAYYPPPLAAWYNVRTYPSDTGLLVYFIDITNQKRNDLHKEQHYRSLFCQNPDAVFSFDLEGNYLSVNPAMVEMFGYSEEEFLSKSFIPLVAQDELANTSEHFNKAAKGEVQHYRSKAIHKDGHEITCSVTNIPIVVEGEIVGVYGIAKDITLQLQAEESLIQTTKLSAVGQLSASIAHEIRNPLTAIKGFLHLLEGEERLQERYLEIMSKEITRIESITGELLLLGKPQTREYKKENMKEILFDIISLLSSQALMNNVDIKINDIDIPSVYGNANQLKQAFINILKNGIESMPDGGCISIEYTPTEDKKNLQFSIRDEGSGIPEDIIPMLGQPFYSTKEKGTG